MSTIECKSLEEIIYFNQAAVNTRLLQTMLKFLFSLVRLGYIIAISLVDLYIINMQPNIE